MQKPKGPKAKLVKDVGFEAKPVKLVGAEAEPMKSMDSAKPMKSMDSTKPAKSGLKISLGAKFESAGGIQFKKSRLFL